MLQTGKEIRFSSLDLFGAWGFCKSRAMCMGAGGKGREGDGSDSDLVLS